MVLIYEDREARNALECDCWLCNEAENCEATVCYCDSNYCSVCGGCSEHCVCAECEACGADCTKDDEKCPSCGAVFVKVPAAKENTDDVPCRDCGVLFHRNTWECPGCGATRF